MSKSHDTQRWVTLVSCLIASLCAGFGYSWSVLLKPIGADFGWSASAVSLSFTVLIVFAASTSIFVGKALQYLQPRTCLLSGAVVFGAGIACIGFVNSLGMLYGLSMVSGVGLGIIYPGATMTNLIRYFPDKRGVASGLLAAGYGIGPVVWAPVSVALIDQFGLMWAMRMLGGLFFVVVAICSRLVSTAPHGYAPAGWAPAVERAAQSRTADKDWKAMLKTPVFWVLAILFTIGTTSGLMVIGHASPIAQDVLGISPGAAGRVVSFLAIGMVVGKIGWGALSDRIGRYPVFVAMLILAASALMVIWGADTYLPLVLGICAVGLCYGGFLALMAPVTAEAFGNKNLGINFGIMFLTVAIAAYVGPRLAAAVYEANGGDYGLAFVIAAMISAVGLVLVCGYMLVARRKAPAKPGGRTRLGGHVEEVETAEA